MPVELNVETAGSENRNDRRFGGWRREARCFIEFFALTGIAIVQPVFDVLRRNSNDIFVIGGASRIQIIALIVFFLFVPPLGLWAVEVAAGLIAPKARRFVHAGLCGAVVGFFALEVVWRQTDLGSAFRITIAIVCALAAVALLLRFSVAGMFLRYLAFAPVVFTVMFVFSAQVSPLVISGSPDASVGGKVDKPSRVVMIVLDEFPTESLLDGTGHVDAELFPNFAELERGSTWYRNMTAVAPYTGVAVPAILTGKYPTEPRAISTAAVYPNNLFTLLGDTYDINSQENVEALNPRGTARGPASFPRLMDRSLSLWKAFVTKPPPPKEILGFQVGIGSPAIRRFARSLGDERTNQLDYLHVLLPHYPWHLLPDGRSYTDQATIAGLVHGWEGGDEFAAVGRQRHILQLQHTDELLGTVFAKLRRLGVYEDSLIVVTADHGMAFTVGEPVRKATPDNYSEAIWVPLFIKAPGQAEGVVDDRLASSVDVVPTIADHLGTEVPWGVDGRSLLGRPRPNGPRRFLEISNPDVSKPPSEAKYRRWDGVEGFQRVLASRAASAGGDPALRVYKGFSEFGDLVGQPAGPFVDPAAPARNGSVGEAGKFTDVFPDADPAPWTLFEGRADGKGGREIAITVNGTVASITQSYDDVFFGDSAFAAVLPPSLFKRGANDIQMYVIAGTPAAPRLEPVTRVE